MTDASQRDAVERAEHGSIDADLGGGLIKQRVARHGQGRSGGYRMILAYRAKGCAVFLYAFAKNERENIDADELADLRALGARWLSASSGELASQIQGGALQEISHDDEAEA